MFLLLCVRLVFIIIFRVMSINNFMRIFVVICIISVMSDKSNIIVICVVNIMGN